MALFLIFFKYAEYSPPTEDSPPIEPEKSVLRSTQKVERETCRIYLLSRFTVISRPLAYHNKRKMLKKSNSILKKFYSMEFPPRRDL